MPRNRFIAGCFLLTAACTAAAADLDGRIDLRDHRGRPVEGEELRQAVAYYTPDVPGDPLRPQSFEMVTQDKQFHPRVLPVPVGSTVRFPNSDPILHNVFSVSPDNEFDLGLYAQGEGVSHTFRGAGLVRVYCNVHHAMVAYILVLETPHFARPDGEGRFRLEGLPEGSGTLTVWHERAAPVTLPVKLPRETPVSVQVDITQRRLPRHLNKLGEPYRRGDRDRYE